MSMFVKRPNGGSGGGGSQPTINVIDSLLSASTTDALSANQGKILKDLVDGLESKITASENLKVFDTELYGMRVFNGEFQYFNTTTSEWVTIQGGSSIAGIVDDLISTDIDKALSANQGRVLNEKIIAHESKIASATELGHVKIDDITIKSNPDGTIYAVQQEGTPIGLENYQMVLPTTQVGQTEWVIPVPEFDKTKHTIIVSHNTVLLTNQMYEITTINGTHTLKLLIDIASEISKNNVFIIILGLSANTGGSGGGNAPVEIATMDKVGVVKPDGITLSVDANGTLSNMFMPTIKHFQTTKIDDPLDASKKIFLLDFERLEKDFLMVIFNDVTLDITDFEFITVPQGSAIRLNITNMVDYDLAYVHGFLYRGFNILR